MIRMYLVRGGILALLLAALCASAPALSQHAPHFPLESLTLGRLQMHGYFVQGGVVWGQAPRKASLQLDDHFVSLSARGKFIFGFSRDNASEALLSVVYSDGSFETHLLQIAQRRYDVQRIDGLPPQQVTPPPEVWQRIAQETRTIVHARARVGRWENFAETWIWPALGRISGVYGSQRILNGEARRPHYGVDISAPLGTGVRAPAGGLVRLAEPDLYYSGGTIILDHGHGLQSTFLHMQRIDVKRGQQVKRGKRLGTIGATGRTTGAHLDWRVNWFSQRLDAQFLLSPSINDRPQ